MRNTLISAFALSVALGITACSKEEPEGTAEQMGKKIDEAVESIKEETTKTVEATQEQASETKAALGVAMEEKGKEMQGEEK